MNHILLCSVALVLGLAASTYQGLQFEAATVKPSPPVDRRGGTVSGGSCRGIDSPDSVSVLFEIPLGRCVFKNAGLPQIIAATFPVQSARQQVSELVRGGPDWARNPFDLEGKAENPGTCDSGSVTANAASILNRSLQALIPSRVRNGSGIPPCNR